jgi:hypothetical protein
MNDPPTSVLETIALSYHQAGWHPFPLPAQAKKPPPDGLTGGEGRDLSAEEIAAIAWTGNLGLRMPADVIGFDVDAYGGKPGLVTFKNLVDRLGPAPNTWISHSGRNDNSGIRFYRVPRGHWVTSLPGIEIIQRSHRYAVAWPSVHPEGRAYEWWDQAEGGPTTEIPLVEDLPELPWPWIAELTRAEVTDTHSRAVDQAGMVDFLTAWTEGKARSYLAVICDHFVQDRVAGFSRHVTMQHCLIWAMEHARAECFPAESARKQLGRLWVEAVAPDARRAELSSPRRTTEFEAMVRHAIGKANAKSPAELERFHDHVFGIAMRPVIDVDQPDRLIDRAGVFINWQEFAKRDTVPHAWLVEQFWPLGRAMALWASAKEGKSELVLWCVAKLAMGEHPWTGQPVQPVDIAYFDFEMTEDDLDERLSDFGFDLDRLDRLHYALLPPIHALNAAEGGAELFELVRSVNAQAVVIDTLIAAIVGDENKSETVHEFTRHTGLRLKQAGIAYLRTDHAGKADKKAPRGTSAKQADVDVTWNLRRTNTGVRLSCAQGSRLSWVGPSLDVDRIIDPQTGIVSYSMPIRMGWPTGTAEKAAELDKVGLPLDAGRPTAVAALKAAKLQPGRNEVVAAALKYRREKASQSISVPGTAQTAPVPRDSDNDVGTGPGDLFSDQP